MKIKPLMRWTEKQTLDILDRTLSGTAYRVFSKVRLNDVLGAEPNEQLGGSDRNFLMTAHFDFLVCERQDYLQPQFAIEFDGPHHQDPEQRKRDIRKNRLCTSAGLPLLRVNAIHLEEHDQLSLLGYMVRLFVAWQNQKHKLFQDIRAYAESMDEAHFLALAQEGDPSLDAGFRFHLQHPFPGLSKAARLLFSNFGVTSAYLPTHLLTPATDRHLVCEVSPGMTTSHKGAFTEESTFAVYEAQPPHRRWRVKNGSERTLFEGKVRFGMKWSLPVVEDYEEDEIPADYLLRTGKLPIAYADPPGVHVPYVVEWFSEYLALREIEYWAAMNLPSKN